MKRNFLKFSYLFIIVFIGTLFSCQNNPHNVDVSAIEVALKTNRFEQDLFKNQSSITPQNVVELNAKYGIFFNDFVERIIQVGAVQHPQINQRLAAFINDTYVAKVKTDVDKLYVNFSEYEHELTEAFKHYRYYFPDKTIPEIITYVSGFNYAIITGEEYLGIGLDMFLGADYKAYAQMGFPKYKTAYMNKKGVVAGAMLGWIATEFELQEKNPDLLTEMIHQGKILYAMDALMPQTAETVKINYSTAQLKWCENNAAAIWFYFVDEQLLYTNDGKEIIKYMGEAPFTQGFPEGSPGRIGHWQGWQIVKTYMKKHPNTTLLELMQLESAQEILKKGNYKP